MCTLEFRHQRELLALRIAFLSGPDRYCGRRRRTKNVRLVHIANAALHIASYDIFWHYSELDSPSQFCESPTLEICTKAGVRD